MATEKQKQAARRNIKKAQQARSKRSGSASPGELSTAQRDRMGDDKFAFPAERKEPLNDAGHVRNAVARFDQVEGVTDAERDRAWKRIKAAAKRYGVEVEAKDWRELFSDGKSRKR
jgi:hypothetical protein